MYLGLRGVGVDLGEGRRSGRRGDCGWDVFSMREECVFKKELCIGVNLSIFI